MDIGMVSRGFPNVTPEECAGYLKNFGFKTTELCFMFSNINTWEYNGYKPMDDLTDELAASIVKTFRDNSIEIVSIGAFSSLFEPDSQKQADNFKAYKRYIQIAANNNIKYISTEAGFIPGRRGINADTYERDFDYFKSNMIKLLDIAERYNVAVAFEPCILDLTPSAKRTRDFILQCERDNLKILLDPANLFANSDEEDMFKYLKDYVAYFHGKDRKVNDAYGKNIGEGDIDWVKFLRLYKKYTPDAPFILEYCNKDNCAAVKQRVMDYEKEISEFEE